MGPAKQWKVMVNHRQVGKHWRGTCSYWGGGSWGGLGGSSLAADGEQLGQKAGVRKLWWVRAPPSGLPDCIEKKVALIHFQFLT